MSITIDNQHFADTLHYRVQMQKTLPQNDVRVRVGITALVNTKDQDQQSLLAHIRERLADFIPAEWALFKIERNADAAGYERVTLKASARIPHTQNYNLTERARLASRDGLALTEPETDYALPAAEVAEVLHELRTEALAEIANQIKDYNHVTGRHWRIGDIKFGIPDEVEEFVRRTSKGAYRAQPEAYLEDADATGGLTAAERIVLIASVTLRAGAETTE
jgi:hypothetical protein